MYTINDPSLEYVRLSLCSSQFNAQGYNFFHIDPEYSDFSCTDRNTGGPQK